MGYRQVASLHPTQVTDTDESYRLAITLDETNATFDYNDFRQSSDWEAGFTDDGIKLGGEMEWHSGKRIEKSWSFQFGGLNRSSTGGDEPEVGLPAVTYSFETSRSRTRSSAGSTRTAGPTRAFLASSSRTDTGCRRGTEPRSPHRGSMARPLWVRTRPHRLRSCGLLPDHY